MIDEELYQQATDELNSDRRRAHLWARACALSSDDHDEARYLYTNLRVEELIAGRERDGGTGSAALADDLPAGPLELEPLSSTDADSTLPIGDLLSLEDSTAFERPPAIEAPPAPSPAPAPDLAGSPEGADPEDAGTGLALDDTATDTNFADAPGVLEAGASAGPAPASPVPSLSSTSSSPAAPAGEDLDATSRIDGPLFVRSVRAGTDGDVNGNGPHAGDADADGDGDGYESAEGSSDDTVDDTESFPTSVRDRMRFELDENEVDLDADEIRRLNDAEPAHPSSIVAAPRTALRADVADRYAGGRPDGSQAIARGVGGRPGHDDAREVPTLRVTPSRERVARQAAPERVRLHDVDDQLDEVLGHTSGAGVAARRTVAPRVRSDYADARDLDSLLEGRRSAPEPGQGRQDDAETLEIVEDDSGRGRRWSVYESTDGTLQAVKRGVCWPALVATLPWLLARGLVGTAILYAALWLASLGGVLVTGAAWLEALDAGTVPSAETVLAFGGFVVIAVAGLVLAPFLRGNRWRTRSLLEKDWELAGELRAPSARAALGRFRELDAGGA